MVRQIHDATPRSSEDKHSPSFFERFMWETRNDTRRGWFENRVSERGPGLLAPPAAALAIDRLSDNDHPVETFHGSL
jgi:hypothetical protein